MRTVVFAVSTTLAFIHRRQIDLPSEVVDAIVGDGGSGGGSTRIRFGTGSSWLSTKTVSAACRTSFL